MSKAANINKMGGMGAALIKSVSLKNKVFYIHDLLLRQCLTFLLLILAEQYGLQGEKSQEQ